MCGSLAAEQTRPLRKGFSSPGAEHNFCRQLISLAGYESEIHEYRRLVDFMLADMKR
jgi:hypothetical protein